MKNHLSHFFWKIYTAGKKITPPLVIFEFDEWAYIIRNVVHGCLYLNLLSELISLVMLVMVVCIWICWVSLYHLIVMLVMVVFHPVGRLDWWSNDATSIIVTWSEENKQGILFNRRLLFFNLYEGGGRSTSRASDLHLHMRPNKGSLHWKLVFIALFFYSLLHMRANIQIYTQTKNIKNILL